MSTAKITRIPKAEAPKATGVPQDKAPKPAPEMGEAFAGIARTLKMNGKTYKLAFNNRTMMEIEALYREHFGRVMGVTRVFEELDATSYTAVIVCFYAAMEMGGNRTVPTWDDFVDDFNLNAVPEIAEVLKDMAGRAIPEPTGEAKNAQTPPGKPKTTTGHGRG